MAEGAGGTIPAVCSLRHNAVFLVVPWLVTTVLIGAQSHSWAANTPGAAKLDLAISAVPVGDGATPVTLTVQVASETLARRIKTIRVTANAGRVGDVKRTGSLFEAAFVPPLLATSAEVVITAEAQVGGRILRVVRTFLVAPQAEPPSLLRTEGAFDLQISPAQMVLGRDLGAVITIRRRDGVTPHVFTNVGEVGDWEPYESDRLRATYKPPSTAFPQVALIAVVASEAFVGLDAPNNLDWAAVPLLGSGAVSAKTIPKANVIAKVHERTFGPFAANANGRVSLPIVAPPGVLSGTTQLVDGSGPNIQFDLGVPKFGRLLLVCSAQHSRAMALIVDSFGKPQEGAKLELAIDAGRFGEPRMRAPGLYDVTVMPVPDAAPEWRATLQASLAGDKLSKSRCTVGPGQEVPAQVTVVVEPTTYTAGSGGSVSVLVRVADARGRAVSVDTVMLEVSVGEVSLPSPSERGVFTAMWQPKNKLDARRQAQVEARVHAGALELVGSAQIQVQAARPESISVQAARARVRGDALDKIAIHARLVDAYGNTVFGFTPTASASAGAISDFADEDGDGVLSAAFAGPYTRAERDEVIVIRDADTGLSATLPIGIDPRLAGLALGVTAGYGDNFGTVRVPVVGCDVALPLSFVSPKLQLRIAASLYRHETRRPAHATSDAVDLSLTTVPAMAHLVVRQPLSTWSGGVQGYAGVGGGVFAAFSSLHSQFGAASTARSLVGALGALGGADIGLGPGRFGLELQYHRASAVASAGVRGSLGGLRALAAYRFEL